LKDAMGCNEDGLKDRVILLVCGDEYLEQ
jgi:hypothetical protein